jgi:hypothetical protein
MDPTRTGNFLFETIL